MVALAHPEWLRARDEVFAALAANCRWVAVLGLPGTGKTILLNDIGRALAWTSGTPMTNTAEWGSAPILLIAAGPGGTALIDDCDRLDDAALAALAAPGAPQCILAGPPELAGRLVGHVPTVEIVGLGLLRPDAARVYLELWLGRERVPASRVTEEASVALLAAAGGLPRYLSELAGRAVRLAGEESARRVTGRHVHLATSLLGDLHGVVMTEARRRPWRASRSVPVGKAAIGGSLAVAAACVCLFVLRSAPPPPRQVATASAVVGAAAVLARPTVIAALLPPRPALAEPTLREPAAATAAASRLFARTIAAARSDAPMRTAEPGAHPAPAGRYPGPALSAAPAPRPAGTLVASAPRLPSAEPGAHPPPAGPYPGPAQPAAPPPLPAGTMVASASRLPRSGVGEASRMPVPIAPSRLLAALPASVPAPAADLAPAKGLVPDVARASGTVVAGRDVPLWAADPVVPVPAITPLVAIAAASMPASALPRPPAPVAVANTAPPAATPRHVVPASFVGLAARFPVAEPPAGMASPPARLPAPTVLASATAMPPTPPGTGAIRPAPGRLPDPALPLAEARQSRDASPAPVRDLPLASVSVAVAVPAIARAAARFQALPAVSVASRLPAAIPSPALMPAELRQAPEPGLLLIARGGDTLESLFAKVYQGVTPPSFAAVAAANPRHVKSGDVLMFPPPPGGWKKQRVAAR